jgi:tellurium resistance protein TerZ
MARIAKSEVEFLVTCSKFGVGVSWDWLPAAPIDLDLQGVIFDSQGVFLDAVYNNNLKALAHSLTLSRDEMSGEKSYGSDRVLWVNVERLPAHVGLVVFAVAAVSGGRLQDAQDGHIHLFEEKARNEVAKFRLEECDEGVDLVGALIRDTSANAGGWKFRLVQLPRQNGQHFVDILEPCIGNFVRKTIPGAPQRIKAAFTMEQAAVVDLPRTVDVSRINVALGWDATQGDVDLDVAALLLDQNAAVVEAIFCGKLKAHGIMYSGDSLTYCVGEGHEEVITASLESISAEIQQVAFVINVCTKGKSFQHVANPYCRITTLEGEELCRYCLSDAGHEQGLLMARLFREPGDLRWGFHAIGMPCRGETWQSSVPDVQSYVAIMPQDLESPSATSAWDGFGSRASTRSSALHAASKRTSGAGADVARGVPLTVTMISASGVRSADWNGLSDPYCVCTVVQKPGSSRREASTKAKTKTRMFTLQPVWDETFQVRGYVQGDTVSFTVMDYDWMRSDDYLGSAVLGPEELARGDFEGDLPLFDDGQHGSCPKITGSLRVRVAMR